MAELSFAKSFLASLESKPIKLQPDHVFDSRSFQPRQPITLPRLSDAHPPMPKKIKTSEAPGSSKSITVNLKSARNPVLDVTLDKVPLSTSTIQDLKEGVQARVKPTSSETDKVPLDKIKILWKRKPVPEKRVAEVLTDEPGLLAGGSHAEFGVMILGGATVLSPAELEARAPTGTTEDRKVDSDAKEEPQTRDTSRAEVLHNPSFWNELEDFLRTKVNDEQEAARLKSLFKDAWQSSR